MLGLPRRRSDDDPMAGPHLLPAGSHAQHGGARLGSQALHGDPEDPRAHEAMSSQFRNGSWHWRQADEWFFIRHLGSHGRALYEDRRLIPTRIELLRGYREGLKLRTVFDGLDREQLLAAVEGEIRLEETREGGAA